MNEMPGAAMEERPDAHVASGAAPRWGMTIDVNRCVGCQTCVAACKHANDTAPGVQWRSVIDVEYGRFPDVERLFLVVGCQHCEEPPCVPVCPTGATTKRADGLVTMDYDLCIGCASCVVACPYQARTLKHDRENYFGDRGTVQEDAVAHPERLGVAQKCTFCKERVDDGLARGLKPGVDPEASPACASSCIAEAIQFGDLNDPESKVSRLVREKKSFRMHEELGTRPGIHYLYETPAVPGRDPGPADCDDESLADAENPLVGPRQSFWDFRAAANFIFGGMGSGLAVIAGLLYVTAGLTDWVLHVLFVASGALIATGLACVFFKIGRKARFLYALLRPQSSWMTREIYAVAVFYPSLAFDLWRPNWGLHALVTLAALAFLVSQARILFASKGIPAWRAPLIPWMLAMTGLFEGAGLTAMAFAFLSISGAARGTAAAFGLVLCLANAVLWHRYKTSAKACGIMPLARREIDGVSPVLHLVGHGVPAALFAAALLVPATAGALALLVAGIGAVAGGILWKLVVILRASYQQGFALAKLPRRGSGSYAAPPAFPALAGGR